MQKITAKESSKFKCPVQDKICRGPNCPAWRWQESKIEKETFYISKFDERLISYIKKVNPKLHNFRTKFPYNALCLLIQPIRIIVNILTLCKLDIIGYDYRKAIKLFVLDYIETFEWEKYKICSEFYDVYPIDLFRTRKNRLGACGLGNKIKFED